MADRIKELLDHPAVELVRRATRSTEFDGNVFLVGGCVRDALLGRPLKNDVDVVSELDSQELAERLHRFDPASVGQPQNFTRFGTAMVTVAGVQVELVTARKESYSPDSRKPNTEPASLLEDAQRRDFTANSLLLGIHSRELTDPLGTGLVDLDARILRTPLNPAATFFDDPLRMLRAVRFRFQLGFDYAEGLAEAITAGSGRLEIISQERIRDEFAKMLLGPSPSRALDDLNRFGLLSTWAPELEQLSGVTQGKWHHTDVWGHTMEVVENASAASPDKTASEDQLTLLLAALLHDIAKPATRSVDMDGEIRFIGHEGVGAELARTLCLRWRFSTQTAEDVSLLVRNHMRLCGMQEVTKAAARRIVRDLGSRLDNWFRLLESDSKALNDSAIPMELAKAREVVAQVIKEEPRSEWQSPLTGDEIMELTGLGPGPEIGRLKNRLDQMVLDGEIPAGDRNRAKEALNGLIGNGS